MNGESKHFDAYYDHVLGKKPLTGAIAKVYNIIADIKDRRGIKHIFNNIDAEIQDEIIERWKNIIASSYDLDWTSVKDECPSSHVPVLVMEKNGKMSVDEIVWSNNQLVWDKTNPTHWMTLPNAKTK